MQTEIKLIPERPADYENVPFRLLILKTERNCMLLIEALNLYCGTNKLSFTIDKYNDTNTDIIIVKNPFSLKILLLITDYINANQ